MTNCWLVVGSPGNWRTAFEQGNIWGLRESQLHLWERLSENETLLFYATQPVGGIIGRGMVCTKFKQNSPLWPQELQQQKVIWPLRFEFDVQACLPPIKWKTDKLVSNMLRPRSGFQVLAQSIANELTALLKGAGYVGPSVKSSAVAETQAGFVADSERPPKATPTHDEVKKALLEIGRLQKFVTEEEYAFDIGRLDVVWRRVQQSVPTYVFEVNVGGDVYHALAKLKHAFDLWNSHVFIVAREEDHQKVQSLLSGTFHEIGHRLKFIEVERIDELYERKKAYLDLEKALGI